MHLPLIGDGVEHVRAEGVPLQAPVVPGLALRLLEAHQLDVVLGRRGKVDGEPVGVRRKEAVPNISEPTQPPTPHTHLPPAPPTCVPPRPPHPGGRYKWVIRLLARQITILDAEGKREGFPAINQ